MSRPIVTRYARFNISELSEREAIEAILTRSEPLIAGAPPPGRDPRI